MSLINYEINLISTWSENCVIFSATGRITFLYQRFLYVTLSTEHIDGTYKINLDDYKSLGTHWMTLYVNAENVMQLDSFGVEYIPKEIGKFKENKSITKIYRMQTIQ